MGIRKAISKAQRIKIYEKYNGHCAYCGCAIKLEEMQVDHLVAVGRVFYSDKEADEMMRNGEINKDANLMPSCRQCNFYKSMEDIEAFRNILKNVLQRTCINTFQAKLALKYGMISQHEWDGIFYFEKLNDHKQ